MGKQKDNLIKLIRNTNELKTLETIFSSVTIGLGLDLLNKDTVIDLVEAVKHRFYELSFDVLDSGSIIPQIDLRGEKFKLYENVAKETVSTMEFDEDFIKRLNFENFN